MHAPSHTYQFSRQDLLSSLGLPLLPVAFFAAVLHLGAFSGLLPRPRPALDTDRTILFHQAQASTIPQGADLLLLGDSSCLMDVAADRLTTQLHGARNALNLGTLSYLDLAAFGSLLEQYIAANPGQVRTVVLLMHPEALRRPSAVDYYVEALDAFYAGRDYCGPSVSPISRALGLETFRGRVLSRVLPQPLPGGFGRAYGFTHDLWEYLSAHQGSALDPSQFNLAEAHGNAEYRLAASLESKSRTFRGALPPKIKLLVGITPIPKGLANADFEAVRNALLVTWSQWLRSDAVLDGLPATMADELFASPTHLNAEGVRIFTDQLATALAPQLSQP